MTHEPECPRSWTSILSGKPLYDDVFEGFECGYCLIATRAYKRGREDAAEAVRLEFLNEPVSAARLMAAARGESQ